MPLMARLMFRDGNPAPLRVLVRFSVVASSPILFPVLTGNLVHIDDTTIHATSTSINDGVRAKLSSRKTQPMYTFVCVQRLQRSYTLLHAQRHPSYKHTNTHIRSHTHAQTQGRMRASARTDADADTDRHKHFAPPVLVV